MQDHIQPECVFNFISVLLGDLQNCINEWLHDSQFETAVMQESARIYENMTRLDWDKVDPTL